MIPRSEFSSQPPPGPSTDLQTFPPGSLHAKSHLLLICTQFRMEHYHFTIHDLLFTTATERLPAVTCTKTGYTF